MIEAKIILDSTNQFENRLTTFELTFPRFILAEFNTHRALSRVSASSRAIPLYKTLSKVINTPFVPTMEKNQSGMQSSGKLSDDEVAKEIWLQARNSAVYYAYRLSQVNKKTEAEIEAWGQIEAFLSENGFDLSKKSIGAHKQWVNRLIEPFMYHKVIASGTDWANFFALRTHKDAQPEFRELATLMAIEYQKSVPVSRNIHLPLVTEQEHHTIESDKLVQLCAARCARTSYLNHNGVRDLEKDYELFKKLCVSEPRHFSPLEFPAYAATNDNYYGNFKGWIQYRKTIENENIKEFVLPTEILNGHI